MEHAARLTGVGLVFTRLTQLPLERDRQLRKLVRSVTTYTKAAPWDGHEIVVRDEEHDIRDQSRG
jgi:hypothetical protein